MKELGIRHQFTVGNTNINVYHGDINEGLNKHEHLYAHCTVCHAGKIRVSKEGKTLEMTKDTKPVLLKQNEWHEVEILENNTVFANIFEINKY